jgi:cyclophilin family peptidyl-prolyl cis-trans isomerase
MIKHRSSPFILSTPATAWREVPPSSLWSFLLKRFYFATLLIPLFFSGCVTTTLPSSEPQVAVIKIQFPKEREPRRVVIAFCEKSAPQTVSNFKTLVTQHYYDGMRFHRIFPHTLVQTGDPKSRHGESNYSGTGGPGCTVPAEIHLPHRRGAVAMSRLPDKINPLRASNGSQFYVCLEPLPQLDGEYTVFGQVQEGLDVLDALSTRPANSNNFPMERIVIKSIRLEPDSHL